MRRDGRKKVEELELLKALLWKRMLRGETGVKIRVRSLRSVYEGQMGQLVE
jgi:hypothetical protein